MVNECYTMEDSSIFKRKERKGAQRFRKGIPSHLCESPRTLRLNTKLSNGSRFQ